MTATRKHTTLWRRTGTAVALLSALALVWGAIRAIAYGEQQPARALLVFGGIALAVCLASGLRRGDSRSGPDRLRADEARAATQPRPDEERMGPEALREIIAEVELPIQEVYRGGGDVHLPAWRLVAVAKRRYMLGEDAEQVTDTAVADIGGERISVVDPWRVLPDLIRKLRGRSPLPKGDLYVIPRDVFQAAREGSHPRREGGA